MNIDYTNAYSNERREHAHMKRRQREAVVAHKATRSVSARPFRTTIGEQLVNIGQHLSDTRPQVPSTVSNIAHV